MIAANSVLTIYLVAAESFPLNCVPLDSSKYPGQQKYKYAEAMLMKKISIETGSGEIPDVWMESVKCNNNSLEDRTICQKESLVVGAAQQSNNSAIIAEHLNMSS